MTFHSYEHAAPLPAQQPAQYEVLIHAGVLMLLGMCCFITTQCSFTLMSCGFCVSLCIIVYHCTSRYIVKSYGILLRIIVQRVLVLAQHVATFTPLHAAYRT
jgi:hypothetical protein